MASRGTSIRSSATCTRGYDLLRWRGDYLDRIARVQAEADLRSRGDARQRLETPGLATGHVVTIDADDFVVDCEPCLGRWSARPHEADDEAVLIGFFGRIALLGLETLVPRVLVRLQAPLEDWDVTEILICGRRGYDDPLPQEVVLIRIEVHGGGDQAHFSPCARTSDDELSVRVADLLTVPGRWPTEGERSRADRDGETGDGFLGLGVDQ